MISAVGNDHVGHDLVNHLKLLKVDISGVRFSDEPGHNTSTYMAIFNHKHDLHLAIADLKVLEESLNIDYVAFFSTF